MIEGKVIFKFSDGSTKAVRFNGSIRGICRRIDGYNQRPKSYQVSLGSGSLTPVEASRLEKWLNQLPSVFGVTGRG